MVRPDDEDLMRQFEYPEVATDCPGVSQFPDEVRHCDHLWYCKLGCGRLLPVSSSEAQLPLTEGTDSQSARLDQG